MNKGHRNDSKQYIQAYQGSVTSGLGNGKEFVSLSGYQDQFVKKLGYEPFPGTLNMDLSEKSIERRPLLESRPAINIKGWSDGDREFGPVKCYPATIHSNQDSWYGTVHIVVPKRTDHDISQLEIISDVKLRSVLNLSDGDQVTVIERVIESNS
ncbi:DUF120 domain-containing protein [Natrinema halophilum]|uniref:DUF120 domain-containing protein n=1 Tax=Natrinema halophilum TaxID=1699371 RepID=UPI003CCD27EE